MQLDGTVGNSQRKDCHMTTEGKIALRPKKRNRRVGEDFIRVSTKRAESPVIHTSLSFWSVHGKENVQLTMRTHSRGQTHEDVDLLVQLGMDRKCGESLRGSL